MTVKHEIKSQLAKLLATEDLIVEHKVVETAEFNVHTRVLTLPLLTYSLLKHQLHQAIDLMYLNVRTLVPLLTLE